MTSTATTTDTLAGVVRERARAEAREIGAMLEFRDAEIARIKQVQPPMRQLVERSGIAMTIGQAMGLSEGQVHLRLSAASRAREQAPRVWVAFTTGRVDFARVRDIAATIDRLHCPESIALLDERVVDYAVGHTAAELRIWLRRFVQRLEADLAVERADQARRDRHVTTNHHDDSMGWLGAYLPSHQVAAIEARLHDEARRPVGPEDDRTVTQREADLLAAWCTSDQAASSPADVNVAVMIDADVLAGAREGFAESTDGRWAAPASWVTEIALTGNPFWHRMVLDPVTADVLSHEYLGRYAPEPALTRPWASGASQAAWCERQRATGWSGEERAAAA